VSGGGDGVLCPNSTRARECGCAARGLDPTIEHVPEPCDACAAAGVMCNLVLGERYCDGSPADVVDTPI